MGSVLPYPTKPSVMEYEPRSQFVPFHKRKQRHAVIITHRRCGKTVATITDLVLKAVLRKDGRYAYVGPTYSLAKDVAWAMLKNYSRPFWRETPNESELRVNLRNGSEIRLYGSDNPDALRGRGFDMVVLDEYADCPPQLFPAVIRPSLSDKQGRVVFIGTVRGRSNHLWETYTTAIGDPEWFTLLLPASETGLIPEAELAAAKRDMGEYRFSAEFACNPDAPIVGSYYGPLMRDAELAGRIIPDLEVIDSLPVHTAWDLGSGANMFIWAFQITPDGLLLHDCINESGWFFPDYIAEVKRREYSGKCFLPHDAAVKDFTTGRTRVETLVAAGLKPTPVPMHNVEDRINAAQLTLPKCRFNSTKCAKGLEGLRNYKVDYDEKLKVSKDLPRHDWASHPADSFGYMAMGYKQTAEPEPPPGPLQIKTLSGTSYDEYTGEEIVYINGAKHVLGPRAPRPTERL